MEQNIENEMDTTLLFGGLGLSIYSPPKTVSVCVCVRVCVCRGGEC